MYFLPRRWRGAVAGILLGAVLAIPAMVASEQMALAQAAAQPAGVAASEAECVRLRAELDRTSAEIAALKRGVRSVANDFRLRQKMADAEALARSLTAAEARLAAARGARPTPPAIVGSEPVAAPGDGPIELEAKADLLADQARRLAAQADALSRNAGQIR